MITKLQSSKNIGEVDEIRSYEKSYMSPAVNGLPVKFRKKFTIDDKVRIVIHGQSSFLSIENICAEEGISIATFNKWTKEFLSAPSWTRIGSGKTFDRSIEDIYRIVIEGKSGKTSVAGICRREGISQDMFLQWCEEFVLVKNRSAILYKLNNPIYRRNVNLVKKQSCHGVLKYLESYIDLSSKRSYVLINPERIEFKKLDNALSIISLSKINDVRYINKYFEQVNASLNNDGIFIGCLETFSARKERMKINKIPLINDIYFSLEFLVKRIIPKVSFTKKYYFDITKGDDRLLSKAEGLGRLVSCGFSIMDHKSIDGLTYFVAKKIKEPYFDENPSYGPLYKMPRLGKNGETIGVYKFRTMHPYSEYLQDYIVNAYGYANTGKPANDFRIPAWGKIMRKYWLDELPQLINVFKGEMKLVGVRPVSKRYFQDIPKEMQKLRLTQKPGCVPPYVALNREGNVMSVLQSEREYLEEKIKNPYYTDLRYFFNAIFNIVFNHKRSA